MKSFASAQKLVCLVFILSIFAYLYQNIRIQRYDIRYGLSTITPPASASEYGGKLREAESALNSYTYRRDQLVDFYSYIQALLGKEENGHFDLVRARDGSLNYGDFYHDIPPALEEYALRVRNLADFAGGVGSQVIFLNMPPVNVEGYHSYSAGLPYQDENLFMDAMLFFLQGLDVDYIDMRTVLSASELAPERYRYKTDVHWTVEASFEGFRALVRTLGAEYGESLDPDGLYTDIGNYSGVLYPGGMVGSLGKRAGIYFSGREDFTMLLPDYATSFSVERDDGGEITRADGDFYEAIIDADFLSTDNLYMSYLGGLAPFRRIVNNNNADGPRILFLSDSFSLPLAAFLSCAVGEVDMLYPLSREVFGYSINIDEYVTETAGRYDYIFVELSTGNFNDSGFSFFRGDL